LFSLTGLFPQLHCRSAGRDQARRRPRQGESFAAQSLRGVVVDRGHVMGRARVDALIEPAV